MEYYLALLAHEDYYDAYMRQLPTHRDHQLQWAAQQGDRVVAVGALDGFGFDQLWLLRAGSRKEAKELMETSPDMRRKLVGHLEIVPWRVRWGAIG